MRKLVMVCGLCFLTGIGCFGPQHLGEETAKQGRAASPGPRPPPVRPESINESNARAKAQELAAELQFDAQQAPK